MKLIEKFNEKKFGTLFFSKTLLLIVLAFSLTLSGCVTLSHQGEVSRAKSEGNPILIVRALTNPPNSVGGIDVGIQFFNLTDEPLKYVIFEVTPFNAVGDIVASEISQKTTEIIKVTGPIEPVGGVSRGLNIWRAVWYNYSIRCFVVDRVTIITMEDSEKTLRGSEVNSLFSKSLTNKCSS